MLAEGGVWVKICVITFRFDVRHMSGCSQSPVIRVTEHRVELWHNYPMKSVGAKTNILKASEKLRSSLDALGINQHYPAAHVLFREDGNSVGVYLVCKGKVRMGVRDLPNLDRDFGAGSLLGLPATFTGHRYSLTAVTLAESEVVHVPRAAVS